jgi:hypothetical protein
MGTSASIYKMNIPIKTDLKERLIVKRVAILSNSIPYTGTWIHSADIN